MPKGKKRDKDVEGFTMGPWKGLVPRITDEVVRLDPKGGIGAGVNKAQHALLPSWEMKSDDADPDDADPEVIDEWVSTATDLSSEKTNRLLTKGDLGALANPVSPAWNTFDLGRFKGSVDESPIISTLDDDVLNEKLNKVLTNTYQTARIKNLSDKGSISIPPMSTTSLQGLTDSYAKLYTPDSAIKGRLSLLVGVLAGASGQKFLQLILDGKVIPRRVGEVIANQLGKLGFDYDSLLITLKEEVHSGRIHSMRGMTWLMEKFVLLNSELTPEGSKIILTDIIRRLMRMELTMEQEEEEEEDMKGGGGNYHKKQYNRKSTRRKSTRRKSKKHRSKRNKKTKHKTKKRKRTIRR